MDSSVTLTWVYAIVSATILLFGAKDFILLKIWTVCETIVKKIQKSDSCAQSNRKLQETNSAIRSRRLIACREISDMILFQTLGWAAVLLLALTPALTCAFLPSADTPTYHLVVFLLSVQLGKLIFKAFFHLFVTFSLVSCIHCSAMALCYLAFLFPGACSTIALIGLVSDAADVHKHVSKVMDLWKVPCYAKWRVLTYAFGLVVTLVVRCLLPLTLVILAVTYGNPISMSHASIALFFFFLTYTAAINIFLMVTVTSHFQEAKQLRCLYLSALQDFGRTIELARKVKVEDAKYRKELLFKTDMAILATVA